MNDYFFHLPGQLSRRGVIDVGLKCPSKCVHCFTREPGRAAEGKDFERNHKSPWRPTEQLVEQAHIMGANGFLATDITGGEPTLHPGIVEIVRACAESNVSPRIITLGQFLDRNTLLDRLLGAGLVDMRFSRHAHTEELFNKITGGSLKKQSRAMKYLDDAGFQYTTNTTIIEDNYRHLPDIAWDLRSHYGLYYANFIFFMPHYAWSDQVNNAIRPKYSAVAPYLREAVGILEDGGIAVGVRYAPQCTIAGLEKNYAGMTSVYYDPHEWMNAVEHSGDGSAQREGSWRAMRPGEPSPGAWFLQEKVGGPIIGRGSPAGVTKLFPPQCQQCSAQKVCDGADKSYLDTYGAGEFVPYIGDDRGAVIDRERVRYFAGHVVKRGQYADVKKVTKRLLRPNPISGAPRVSVVMANYNYGEWLVKAINSVLEQTYLNVELIVVDDASTDNSRQILSGLPHSNDLKVIFRDENSGNSARPHNEAIAQATGELIMYLDSDDWLEPSYIEEAVNVLRQNPWASFVYPGLSTFGLVEEQWQAIPFDPHREIMSNFVPYCALYRRTMYDDIGGYVEDIKGAEDFNFWVSAVRLGHMGVPLPRQLMHYNRRSEGIFETEVRPNLEKKHRQIYLRNYEVYPPEVVHWARNKNE